MAWYNPLDWGKGQTDPKKAQLDHAGQIADTITQGLAGVQGRAAPQADNTQIAPVRTGVGQQQNTGQSDQFRQLQMQQAQRLAAIANGTQAGAGELATQRQVAQGLAAQQAMARMGRGGGAGISALAGARGAADLATSGAGQAQQAALQDQSNAQGLLTGALGQGRSQDIGIAGQNAELGQQMNLANLSAQNQAIFQQAGLNQSTSLANMQARLQAMGMNDQAIGMYLQALLGMDQATLQARMQQEATQLGQKGIGGDLLSAAGTLGAAYLTGGGK